MSNKDEPIDAIEELTENDVEFSDSEMEPAPKMVDVACSDDTVAPITTAEDWNELKSED